MPELIYRDVAKFQACNWKVKSNDDAIFDGIKESIKRLLDLAPAVDAVPVVHGEWFPVDPDCRDYTDVFNCSVCDANVHMGLYAKDCDYEYCPNCGAKMDGERKEDERGNNNDSPADH